MSKIAVIGEVMIELSPQHCEINSQFRLGFAGDSFNTAIYLARLGTAASYITRLGDDNYSDDIVSFLINEGIGTELIDQVAAERPGLYLINNFDNGEREFHYWRGQAAVKKLFSNAESQKHLFHSLQKFGYIYLTGITLAVIQPEARLALFKFLNQFKQQGGKIIYDSNYRPLLWKDLEETQTTAREILSLCDIAILTLEDEQLIWGENEIKDYLNFYRTFNISEVIIKRGAKPTLALTSDINFEVEVPKVDNVTDTTAAGDSFNAGYLNARLAGDDIETSIIKGNHCASIVIQHKGAIIDKSVFQKKTHLPHLY